MIGFKKTATVALLASGLALGNTAQAGLLYNIMDLGALSPAPIFNGSGGYNTGTSYGQSINASGQVTGNSFTRVDDSYHAFITNNSVMSDLGSLGFYRGGSYGNGINASGQVTGGSYINSSYNPMPHAFITNHGVMTDLGTLGGEVSWGMGINDSGQVTGTTATGSGK